MYTHPDAGPVTGACAEAGAGCKSTCGDGGEGQPTAGTLSAVGVLPVACCILLWTHGSDGVGPGMYRCIAVGTSCW